MPGPFRLEGKRAHVRGASRGIGRAIALALADAGADVAVTSRSGGDEPIAGEIRAQGRRSLALLRDVRHAQSIRVCFERLDQELGGLDILVNNAGTTIPQVTPAAAQRVIAAKSGGRIRERLRSIPGYREEEIARIPVGRLGTPEDVAAAAVFFASPDASFVTGQTLLVDGGTSAY